MAAIFVVLNAGSSSLKFQVFETAAAGDARPLYRGQFEALGTAPRFIVKDCGGTLLTERVWDAGQKFGHEEALIHLVAWTRESQTGHYLAAVGHRVVHGGPTFSAPVLVDEPILQTLDTLTPLAPLHQPHNLEPIRIIARRLPDLPQVACFDTAFHYHQPDLAQLFALPADIRERGVRRYGFHGLSYEYIASVLAQYDSRLAAGRVIVAHLGNGASLCALSAGSSIATTMGFSALDGLPMGTRCGALDAGVVFYMLREMKLDVDEAERILYTKSGLLGVSGVSNDMRTLRARASTDPAAGRAIGLFTYRIIREIGSLIAALGGIDGLVFTAGIGENDAATRADVLSGLAWAGFAIDDVANDGGGPRITGGSGPSAWVIPTNEELIVARHMQRVLGKIGHRHGPCPE